MCPFSPIIVRYPYTAHLECGLKAPGPHSWFSKLYLYSQCLPIPTNNDMLFAPFLWCLAALTSNSGGTWPAFAFRLLSRVGAATGRSQSQCLRRDRPGRCLYLRRNPAPRRALCIVPLRCSSSSLPDVVAIDATVGVRESTPGRDIHFGKRRKSVHWIDGCSRTMDVSRSLRGLDGGTWIFRPGQFASLGTDPADDAGCITAVCLYGAEEPILGQFPGLALRLRRRSGHAEAPDGGSREMQKRRIQLRYSVLKNMMETDRNDLYWQCTLRFLRQNTL